MLGRVQGGSIEQFHVDGQGRAFSESDFAGFLTRLRPPPAHHQPLLREVGRRARSHSRDRDLRREGWSQMDEIRCSVCAAPLLDGDEAYGITRGVVDQSTSGLLPDPESEWSVLCSDCMNDVDRLMANLGRSKST
jgi:hypothetical protein